MKDKKEENIRDEERKLNEFKKLNEEAGWKKVVASINLKQGEHKGKKDISRMR